MHRYGVALLGTYLEVFQIECKTLSLSGIASFTKMSWLLKIISKLLSYFKIGMVRRN